MPFEQVTLGGNFYLIKMEYEATELRYVSRNVRE